MSRRKRKKPRKVSPAFGKRFRTSCESNPTIKCGDIYVTVNGGRSWTYVQSYDYDPAVYGRPYSRGFGLADECHPGPPYKTGGPFSKFTFLDAFNLSGSGTHFAWFSPDVGYKYVGGFVPGKRFADFFSGFTSAALADGVSNEESSIRDLGDVSTYGATGWNKFRPGNPTADLGVFLGELRDVPRMLSGTAKFFHNAWRAMGGSLTGFTPKKVADYWLNTQFGWRPFISDLRKFYRTYTKLDEHLNRIRRDNGKWKRRGGTVQQDSDTKVIEISDAVSAHWPSLPWYFYPSGSSYGNYTMTEKYSRHVWFEGAFRYWIPDIGSVQWKKRAIAELFGVMPCPSLIWNLIPWSWLVDWCSNVGDVISNMSTGYADNLAAKYAYVMGHTERTGVLDSTLNLVDGKIHNSWSFPLDWKTRTAASPFGFGLSDDSFSVRQLSILAALGISRLK